MFLNIFAKFAGKQLCWSFFLIKLTARPATSLELNSSEGVPAFCEFCKIFRRTFLQVFKSIQLKGLFNNYATLNCPFLTHLPSSITHHHKWSQEIPYERHAWHRYTPYPTLFRISLFWSLKKEKKRYAPIHDTSSHFFKQLRNNQNHDFPRRSILINNFIVFLLSVLRTQKV